MPQGYVKQCTPSIHVWDSHDEEIPNGLYCQCGGRQWWDPRTAPDAQEEYCVEQWTADGAVFLGNRHATLGEAIREADRLTFERNGAAIRLRIRRRYVGQWADIVAFGCGAAILPANFDAYYTRAPAAYDGFGTHTLEPTNTYRQGEGPPYGVPYRRVGVDRQHLTWQQERNASGGYELLPWAEYQERLRDGLIVREVSPAKED